mmetsp:Transcript_19215/g.41851  ORF Transcript_19215/g.41851 Transcript_19215/m.41851 type:complete len:83 (+) Transcript_19215:156-404(+)
MAGTRSTIVKLLFYGTAAAVLLFVLLARGTCCYAEDRSREKERVGLQERTPFSVAKRGTLSAAYRYRVDLLEETILPIEGVW